MELGAPLRTEIMGVRVLFSVPKEFQVDIKELVKDQRVTFKFFRDDALYYETDSGFRFPVPVEDMKKAVFLPEDKAIIFMRWIRKALDSGKYEQINRGIAQ